MTALFIGSTGSVFPCASAQPPRLLPTQNDRPQDGYEFDAVASVQVRDTIGKVKVIPDRLNYAAYATLAGLLEDKAPLRIILSWYRGSWRDEIIVGQANKAWRVAGQRVLSLMSEARIDRDDRFRLSPASIEDVPHNSLLKRLIDLWRFGERHIDLTKQSEVVSELTNGQYCIFRSSHEFAVPIFDTFGPGWDIYKDRSWINRSVGRPVTEQPDVRYGRWVADYLRDALSAREPTLSTVEAVISDPTGQQRQRHSYMRLTLPLRLRGGERALLSAPHVSSITRL